MFAPCGRRILIQHENRFVWVLYKSLNRTVLPADEAATPLSGSEDQNHVDDCENGGYAKEHHVRL